MINEYKEHWIERVKIHLEKLLDKAKRDNHIKRRMAKYYCRRSQIARPKLKELKSKPKTLNVQEEKGKLDILDEAWQSLFIPNKTHISNLLG